MGLVELLLIAVGLSMDAAAVSISKGIQLKRFDASKAALVALFFGGFQGLMPLIGWLAGVQFASLVETFAPWIAFAVLVVIGGKMIWEARTQEIEAEGLADRIEGHEARLKDPFRLRELLILAVATSIDALAMGVTFALLGVPIVWAASIIAVTTALISFVGVYVGHRFGARYERPAEVLGGAILVGLGVKFLLAALGIL
jgi:putative Mn2+ efflux pump MntP